jgi:hypothetical protein
MRMKAKAALTSLAFRSAALRRGSDRSWPSLAPVKIPDHLDVLVRRPGNRILSEKRRRHRHRKRSEQPPRRRKGQESFRMDGYCQSAA